MPNFRLLTGTLAICCVSSALASGTVCDQASLPHRLTLNDAVNLALCHNPQTRSLWANSRAQAAQVGVSAASFLPTLSAGGSQAHTQTQRGGLPATTTSGRNLNLTASYLLLDFGAREAGQESARQLLVAANASRDSALQTLWLTTAQAYFSVQSARASVQASQAAETAAHESLSAAEARHQSGSATLADRLQAQTALSQATLNRITAEGNAAASAGLLANLMGFDASQTLELTEIASALPDAGIEQSIGELITEARRKRPDLAAAEAQIKAAEAQLSAAHAAGLPTVSLTAGTGLGITPGVPISRSNSIGLSISVPLYTGGRVTHQTRVAEAQLETRVAERDQVANQIALDVWRAYQSLLTGGQALRTAEDLVASAEQSERMTLGRYKAGLGNLLDVLNAQSALASARQQRIAARYNFLSSRFSLTQAIGELDLTRTATL